MPQNPNPEPRTPNPEPCRPPTKNSLSHQSGRLAPCPSLEPGSRRALVLNYLGLSQSSTIWRRTCERTLPNTMRSALICTSTCTVPTPLWSHPVVPRCGKFCTGTYLSQCRPHAGLMGRRSAGTSTRLWWTVPNGFIIL